MMATTILTSHGKKYSMRLTAIPLSMAKLMTNPMTFGDNIFF